MGYPRLRRTNEGHTQQVGAPLDNAAVAERLEAFGGLLDLAGASPYTARANS